jgi:hypothetical protein
MAVDRGSVKSEAQVPERADAQAAQTISAQANVHATKGEGHWISEVCTIAVGRCDLGQEIPSEIFVQNK